MAPLLVYRPSLMPADELEAASRHLRTSPTRLDAGPGDLVIARYSALPFYAEQEADYRRLGATLINTLQAHSFVADLGSYAEALGELTPPTMRYDDWTRHGGSGLGDGPWVLKGATNSKKHSWRTHMFAATRPEAFAVADRLMQDGLVGDQTIYVRAYVPLARYGELVGGLPVTREFRFFVLDGQVISGGFYWASFADDLAEWGHTSPDPSIVPRAFLDEALGRVGDRCRFYGLDVAQGDDGRWWVIELNDAQMAGLSGNDADALYAALATKLRS